MGIASITHDTKWLQVTFTDGETSEYYVQWLRDNIPSGRHQDRGQRTFDINSLPQQSLSEVIHAGDQITITFDPDHYTDVFTTSWLYSHRNSISSQTNSTRTLWGATQQEIIFFADYQTLKNSKKDLHSLLCHVRDYGLSLIHI